MDNFEDLMSKYFTVSLMQLQFVSSSVNTIVKLLRNESGGFDRQVIQYYYVIKRFKLSKV